MKKEELLKELKKARNTEESIISVLSERLKALALRSGMPQDRINAVRNLLGKLKADSTLHHEEICAMIDSIEQGDRNDY